MISPRNNHFETTNSVEALRNLDLATIYDADPRPTFIVDTSNSTQQISLIIRYSNPALNRRNDLISCLNDALPGCEGFRSWTQSYDSQLHYYRYGGTLWYGFVLYGQWKVIGTATEPEAAHEPLKSSSFFKSHTTGLSGHDHDACQASIGQLRDKIRGLELRQRRTTSAKQPCSDCVQRLKEKSYTSDSGAQRPGVYRNLSRDNVPTLKRQHTEMQDSEVSSIGNSAKSPLAGFDHHRQHMPDYARWDTLSPSPTLSVSKVIMPVRVTSDGDDDASIALAKFRQLAEAVDVGFFDYDPSGRLVHANESWYALSGHPREPELHTTLSFNQCVYPDDAELVMEQWNKLMQGQPVTFEMRWKRPPVFSSGSGTVVDFQWVLAACVPVIGEDGNVQSISGCTTDINAQKQHAQVALQRAEALERARASEERFARFAEVAPIAIFRFDKHKNIEYCNDRWFEMTGIPQTQFENISHPFGVLEEDVDLCSQAWEKAIEDHSIGQIEFRLQKEWHDARGRRGQAWVYCTFFAEYAEDGSFNGLMGSLLDISHLKWAENMQKLRAEEALEAKKQQENFIDVTSHEMRNPLSAMMQCADSIISSLTDISNLLAGTAHAQDVEGSQLLHEYVEAGLDASQTILSCAAHQRRIVDDVLTLSKLDSSLLIITPIKTEPIEMARQVIKMFEMDSSKAEVELDLELDCSLQHLNAQWLLLDPSRVSQILINLLGNAIKFTRSEKTRKVVVKMSVSLNPPSNNDPEIDYVPAESTNNNFGKVMDGHDSQLLYLKFEVHDTGRGLNLEEKEKLFMRFSQASPKTHVQYGGSGLGLFISRKLTEMQGGKIGFASKANIGSTFAFYIKSRRTTLPVTNLGALTHASLMKSDPTVSDAVSKKRLRVLMVEDNLVNQKVLGKQLERQGCDVFIAGHGVEAIDFLKTTELWSKPSLVDAAVISDPVIIDVVLMDIEMPVMGGLECTRQIRKLEQEKILMKHLPIISISANARQEQVNEALVAGVDDTITKPFRIQELMPKIQRLEGIWQ